MQGKTWRRLLNAGVGVLVGPDLMDLPLMNRFDNMDEVGCGRSCSRPDCKIHRYRAITVLKAENKQQE